MVRFFALVLAVLLGTTAASGDPEPKSEPAAVAWSVGVTGVSVAILAAAATPKCTSPAEGGCDLQWLARAGFFFGSIGTLIGPSLGHWYAGASRVTSGMKVRLLGLGILALGGLVWFSEADRFSPRDHQPEHISNNHEIFVGVGAVTYLIGMTYDLVTVHCRVRTYNARSSEVALVPAVHPGGGGVAVVGRF